MAEKLVGRGQYTLVSLHDGKSMQVHLNSNLPSIQFFSRQKNAYAPNYTKDNLVISPELLFSGSEESQIGCIKNIVWTINDDLPIAYGGTVSQLAPYSLTISQNMESCNQLHVRFRAVVVDPDTSLEVGIASELCFTKQEEANSTPVLLLEYPNGGVFKNDIYKSLSASSKLMVGSQDISELAQYTWYKLQDKQYVIVEDNVGIFGQSTNTINVLLSHIQDKLHFKCVVKYKNATYTDYVTFSKQTDPFICKIENRNGDKMHNGVGEILCEAHIYQGGVQIPDEDAERLFTFNWVKYSKLSGAKDPAWSNLTGRKIALNKQDIDKLSTFVCEVNRSDQAFPYRLPFVLQ